jgi:hypothetical protein
LSSVSAYAVATTASPAAFGNNVSQSTEVGTLDSVWRRLYNGSKQNEVVEFDIVGPNEPGVLKVVVKERFLRSDFFRSELFCVRPPAVVVVDLVPILRQRNVFNARILDVTVDRSP